jgi:hypothetical protein
MRSSRTVALRAMLLGLGVLVVHFVGVRVSIALYGTGLSDTAGLLCLGLAVAATVFLGQHGSALGRARWLGLVPMAGSAAAGAATTLGSHGWAAWTALVVAAIARAKLPPPSEGTGGAAWLPAALAGLFAILVPSVAGTPIDARYLAWAGCVAASTWACAAARHLDLDPPPSVTPWTLRRRQVPLQLAMAASAVLAVVITSRLSTSWTPLGPILSAFLLARPLARRLAEAGRPTLPAVILSAAGTVAGVAIATVPA